MNDDTTTKTTATTTGPVEAQRVRRGHDFYPRPGDGLPPLYATEDTATAAKTVRVHYFVGGCDWWLVEYDPVDHRGFGYVCLGHPDAAEWGYIDLPELEAVCLRNGLVVVERDLGWTPRLVRELHLPGRPTF